MKCEADGERLFDEEGREILCHCPRCVAYDRRNFLAAYRPTAERTKMGITYGDHLIDSGYYDPPECDCRQPGLGGDCDGSCQHREGKNMSDAEFYAEARKGMIYRGKAVDEITDRDLLLEVSRRRNKTRLTSD